jgi:acetyl-CoA C-acetyltransferase
VNEEAVIIGAVRTAIGKYGRALREVPAPRLGTLVIKEALKRGGIKPQEVQEVVMGNVISAGLGQNPARQCAIHAGIPPEVGSFTVNKVCGSGLKAAMLAAQSVRAGDADVVVAGGMESMSGAPHLLGGLRWGIKFGDVSVKDAMLFDGLWEIYNGYHIAMTGERVADKYGVTREEADMYGFESHRRAAGATRRGDFTEEILPVDMGGVIFERDECVREDTTLEKMSKLPPVFRKDGIITAGNSSQLSDGAAALVIASAGRARTLGIEPLGRIIDYAIGGARPEDVMEAPIPVVEKLLKKTGFGIDEIDLVEYNEAYAASAIVVSRRLRVDPEKFNVNGGAVALGHPIGCSGARILVTLLYAMKNRGLKKGLATLCMGGGNALAMIVER